MKSWCRLPLIACLASFCASAEVVRIDVASRSDLAQGKVYGLVGAYEKLTGRIYYEVEPGNPANQHITDIEYAPANAAGNIEFSADFYLVKPKAIRRGNGAILLEVPNRGRKGMLAQFNREATRTVDPQSAADLGDGFLLKQGFSLLWVGWQFDVPHRTGYLRAYVPVATRAGEPIRGFVRSDFFVTQKVMGHSLGDREHVPYPVADPADSRNVMTVRDGPTATREVVPRSLWRFARSEAGQAVSDPRSVYLRDGFEPGRIYEVVYVAQDPPVAGLGLAAIRDAIAFLKHEQADSVSIPAGTIDRAIAFGASQSGRLLRTFLYDGFNQDEQHRQVFDGIMSHLAGGQRGGFNQRFAQPSRSGEMSFFYSNPLFPFTDVVQTDRVTGRRDGLLARVDQEFVPRIFYTNSSTEYWISPAALSHMTVDGLRDVPPVDTTRVYHFAGTQHAPASFPPAENQGGLTANPNDYGWFLRSLLLQMDHWITTDSLPPASLYPRLADETLVAPDLLRFPELQVASPPDELPLLSRLDYGPDFLSSGIVSNEPPALGTPYPQRVPQVDASGNEISGLRSPELMVPLATYTGWQPFDSSRDDLYVPLGGGLYLPFRLTKAERLTAGDPRPSILELYDNRDNFLGKTAEAALTLIDRGYLLRSDLAPILEHAARHWDHVMSGNLDREP